MDILTIEQRRRNMKKIKNKDTKIELILRKALWESGIRYRKNYNKIPGKPDIAITRYRIAIFCDSEFFHGKDWENLNIRLDNSNNSEFWKSKIKNNRERDIRINEELKLLGWTVLRFWGKDIIKKTAECVHIVKDKMNFQSNS